MNNNEIEKSEEQGEEKMEFGLIHWLLSAVILFIVGMIANAIWHWYKLKNL